MLTMHWHARWVVMGGWCCGVVLWCCVVFCTMFFATVMWVAQLVHNLCTRCCTLPHVYKGVLVHACHICCVHIHTFSTHHLVCIISPLPRTPTPHPSPLVPPPSPFQSSTPPTPAGIGSSSVLHSGQHQPRRQLEGALENQQRWEKFEPLLAQPHQGGGSRSLCSAAENG